MNASEYAVSFMRALVPCVCLRASGDDLSAAVWRGNDWQEAALEDLPQATPFARYVWLVAEEHACFRNRTFPADTIDADSLDEAIALDIQSWSPWGDASGYFYWPVRDGEQWQVAVWTWDADKDKVARARALADSGITLTHAMPEQAWHASAAKLTGPALLLRPAGEKVSCIWINEHGLPARIAKVGNQAEGARFRRSLGGDEDRIGKVFLPDDGTETDTESSGNQGITWVMYDAAPDPVRIKLRPPAGRVLALARLAGVQDWTDPAAWKKPLAALAMLWLLWLAGSGVILWNRSATVDADLRRVRASAEDVLSLRDRVQRMQSRLRTIHALRHRQRRELRFLAALSKTLPADAWLLSIVDEGESVNIQGRAKNAAAIGALLEHIPGIDHVAYLGDIRPDAVSKRESFYLRLHFANAEGKTGDVRRETEDERRSGHLTSHISRLTSRISHHSST